jgi:TRAP-type C4-dicarboxylate transport system permease small subunit
VLVLSVAITIEILGRKLFAFSFHGIDDIGGYVLAITATVGASYTMAVRGHTRVDVFLVRMPAGLQRPLNVLAMVTLALFAAFAAWRGTVVLMESIEFQSVATNPLQTPLWQPQSLWLGGIYLFAAIAAAYAVHAVLLYARGAAQLNRFYGPMTAQDELEAELTARLEREAQAEHGAKP